jgi:hypothetical protein
MRDYRDVPLIQRKAALRDVVPPQSANIHYLDQLEKTLIELFTQCAR